MSKKSFVGSGFVGLFSSILAFLGMVSCCGMPLLAAALAWFGIGASQLAVLSSYQPIFMGIAIVSLMFGFWKVYFKKRSTGCCDISGCCESSDSSEDLSKPRSQKLEKFFLWVGTLAVVVMFFMMSPQPSTSDIEDESCIEVVEESPSSCCS